MSEDKYLQVEGQPEHLFNIYRIVAPLDEVIAVHLYLHDAQDDLARLRSEAVDPEDEGEAEFYNALRIDYTPVVGWIGAPEEVPNDWS